MLETEKKTKKQSYVFDVTSLNFFFFRNMSSHQTEKDSPYTKKCRIKGISDTYCM